MRLTLTELLVVTLILVVLVTLILEGVSRARDKAIDADCCSRLRQLGSAFSSYKCDYRYFPTFRYPSGLEDKANWQDLWADADPMGCFFVTPQVNPPRVPRLMEEYAKSLEVLHCPCQGASSYWKDVA